VRIKIRCPHCKTVNRITCRSPGTVSVACKRCGRMVSLATSGIAPIKAVTTIGALLLLLRQVIRSKKAK